MSINEGKHKAVVEAFTALRAQHPLLTRTAVIQMMAEAAGKPVSTIRYYIRAAQPADHRLKYTAQDIERLTVAPFAELEAEAARRGVTVRSIKTAIGRHQGGTGSRRSPHILKAARLEAELLGYMDFANGFVLRALDLTRGKVTRARKQLRAKWGLDLNSPNLLTHLETGRIIKLTLVEQFQIIGDPIGFIKSQASTLGRRWEKPEVKHEEAQ